jgi:hypothetical protein
MTDEDRPVTCHLNPHPSANTAYPCVTLNAARKGSPARLQTKCKTVQRNGPQKLRPQIPHHRCLGAVAL